MKRILCNLGVVLPTLALLSGAACQSSTAPEEEFAGCVTDFQCSAGMECGMGGCTAVAPSLYSHIQTASALFRPYIDDAEKQFRFSRYDVIIARVYDDVDAIRATNPNARIFEYINIRYNRFDEQASFASDWAMAHGYDPEDFYLHYRDDVMVPGWEGRVLVDGFPQGEVPGWHPNRGANDPPASATARWQSRAIGLNEGQANPWFMANIAHAGYRLFLRDYIASLLDGTHQGAPFAGGPLDGLVLDNAIYYPDYREGVLDKTTNYYGLPYTDYHPYAYAFETVYPELALGLAEQFGYGRDLMPNFGHVYFLNLNNPAARGVQSTTPWAWGEVWLMYQGWDNPQTGTLRCISYDSDYNNAIAAIARETRTGARRVLGGRDVPLNGGGGSDRGRIYLLALYYLVQNRNTWFLYETVNGHAGTTPVSQFQWDPAVEFDVGVPDQVPPQFVDFDGRSGTNEHYVFASGPDPYDPNLTYRVLARNYTNALVLAKMMPRGSVVSDLSITTHTLPGSYFVLQADGTLGPVVTSISLRNNEGAILIPVN